MIPRSTWRIVAGASVPFALAGFGVLELPIRWTSDDLGASGTATGAALAAYGLGYGLAQLPAGFLTGWIGAVAVLRLSLLGALVAWPLTLVDDIFAVTAGRALWGAAAGLVFTAGLSRLRDELEPADYATATPIFTSGWAAGLLVAAFAGLEPMAAGVVIVLLAAVGLVLLRGAGGGTRPAPTRIEASIFRRPGVRALLICLPASLIAQSALVTWGPKVVGLGDDAAVIVSGVLIGVGIVAGSWLGKLGAQVVPGPLVVAAAPVAGGLSLLIFVASDATALGLLAIALGALASALCFAPGFARLAAETSAGEQPLVSASVNAVAWLLSACAPLLLGLTAPDGGTPTSAAWVALAVICCAGAVATVASDRAAPRSAAPRP